MKQVVYWLDVACFLALGALVCIYTGWAPRLASGMVVAATGFALWMAARLQLGSSFHPRPRAHALVTTGLYAKFRNPIYLFGEIAYLGLALAWDRRIGWICAALMIPVQIYRSRQEHAVLEKAFGDQYRAYRARTRF